MIIEFLQEKRDELYFAHSLYATSAVQELKMISTFIKENRHELIFIDFNHFYDMGDEDYNRLNELLLKYLGLRVYLKSCNFLNILQVIKCVNLEISTNRLMISQLKIVISSFSTIKILQILLGHR